MASEVKTGRPGPFAHVSIPDFSISAALILGFIVLTIVMWFVTSSDSGSFVIDMLTAGGLSALQAVAVVAGFPFPFVIIVMLPGLMRGLSRDHLVLYRYEQWYATEQEAEINLPKAYADEEALEGPPAVAKGN